MKFNLFINTEYFPDFNKLNKTIKLELNSTDWNIKFFIFAKNGNILITIFCQFICFFSPKEEHQSILNKNLIGRRAEKQSFFLFNRTEEEVAFFQFVVWNVWNILLLPINFQQTKNTKIVLQFLFQELYFCFIKIIWEKKKEIQRHSQQS